jgi:hypothetical protein
MTRSHVLSPLSCVACLWFASSEPALPAETDRFLCTLSNGQRVFRQPTPELRCLKRVLDNGWVNLVFDEAVLIDYHPDTVVIENDGIKVWLQFFNAKPVQSANSRWAYDYFKGTYKFFCKSRQQLLIQGSYQLNNRTVYERLSNESVLEEIEPGTVSDGLRGFFCKGLMKDSTESANIAPESDEMIAQMNEAEFRFRFRCPESFSSDDERDHEIKRFLNWIASHPHGRGWTLDEVAKFRTSLLETHSCTETLRNIEENGHSNKN